MKFHTGEPPEGWERVPGFPALIREKVIPPPKDGEPGPAGPQGEPGPQGPQGEQGPPGQDGKDGAPGKDGRDGRDGKDGAPGPRGERGPAGPAGKDGKDGQSGVGIEDVKAYGQDMILKMTDGQEKRLKLLGLGGGTAFGGAGGSSGGGGASSLSQLTDVNLTSLGDNQKLVYDASSSKWNNLTMATVTVSATAPVNPKVGDIWFDIS